MKRNIILFSTALALVVVGVLGGTAFRDQITSRFRAAFEHNSVSNDEVEAREEAAAEYGSPEYWQQREQMLRNPVTGKIPEFVRAEELRFASRLPRVEDITGKRGSRLQSLNWSPRGPFNVSGRMRALAIDVGNETTLIAGGVAGGMWRSTDAGASWSRRTALGDLQSVTCVAQDRRPGKHNVWYYGTGELEGGTNAGHDGGPLRGDGIFKSTDGGLTWALLPFTSRNSPHILTNQFNFVHKIVLDSTKSNDVVYAAASGVIFRSEDGGGSWKAVLGEGNNTAQWSDIVITKTGVLYASISTNAAGSNPVKGLFRSTDGIAWTNIFSFAGVPGGEVVNRISLALAPSDENILYIFANWPGQGLQSGNEWSTLLKYTYLSGDGAGSGGNFQNLSENVPQLRVAGGLTGNFNSQGSYNFYIRVKPDNPNVVFIGGTQLFRSTDGFASKNTKVIGGYEPSGMSYAFFPNHHPDQTELIFSPSNPNVAYSLTDGGIFRTENINQVPEDLVWQSLNNGIVISAFYTLAIDHGVSGDNALIGGLQDRGTWNTQTAAPGDPWRNVMGGDGGFCAIGDNKNGLYASFQNGEVMKVIGSRLVKMDPNGGTGYLFINPFILDPNNSTIMYNAGGRDLWRHDDLSIVQLGTQHSPDYDRVQGWTRSSGVTSGGQISAFGASRGAGGTRLYVGTSQGQVLRVDNAQTGTMTPRDVSSTNFPQGGYVGSIDVDPANPDRAVVVFSNYGIQPVWYTTDGGATWAPISGNLRANPDGTGAGPSVRSIAIQTFGGTTRYFLGTSTGVYSTTQLAGGNTVWAQEGTTVIGNATVGMVVARQRDGLVAVATYGAGMFSAQSTAPAQIASNTQGESLVETGAAYPNPVVSETSIPYTLHRAATVRVQVTDASGRVVAEPFIGKQVAGSHTARWDGYKRTNASSGEAAQSGVYFFQVMATDENGVVVRRSGQMSVQR